MKELQPHNKSIDTKSSDSILIDESLRDLTKSATDSHFRSDKRAVVVDTIPYKTTSSIQISKPFFYSLIATLTALLLILAFLLGRNYNMQKTDSRPIIIKASPPSKQIVYIPPSPVSKKEVIQTQPKQVVVMTLPPKALKTEEKKESLPPLPEKQTPTEEEEEVRFIPQGIAPGWQAEDPSITETQEKLKRYASQVNQLLIQTEGWQSIRLILIDLQQGTVRGDKNRTLAIARWLHRAGSQISILEVPGKAKEHHMAVTHFIAQGDAFLTEIASITPQQYYKIKQLENNIHSLIDQMTDIEEMTISLKKDV